jgi:LL-diaminopimelate aminotransferase
MNKQIILFAMAKLNHHYQKLSNQYLFVEIEKKIAGLKQKNPNAALLDLGIGDATIPLFPPIISALEKASKELGELSTFKGYGPSAGYDFLRNAIAENEYTNISADEIFVSDGANSDFSNLQEIFSVDNKIAVQDPSYPTYVDINVMAGRTRPLLKTGGYGGVVYLPCTEENGFLPEPPNVHADLIYLCSPNNPTGVAMNKELLARWVDYAKKHQAVIFFDSAYEAFITSDAPRSIYEVEGAKEVAIEVRTFSKSAGFTGLGCSYVVVPKTLKIYDAGSMHSLHALWKRRVETKFSGVSYPVQKAAAALYSEEGKKARKAAALSYMERAALLRQGLKALGYTVYGGVDSPYVWCKTPPKVGSWEFFDFLLENIQVATVPGVGFGRCGDGYVRLSAFAGKYAIEESLQRFRGLA